jgi:hypothetical protein
VDIGDLADQLSLEVVNAWLSKQVAIKAKHEVELVIMLRMHILIFKGYPDGAHG